MTGEREALRKAAQEWADLCHDYDLNERGQAVMGRLRAALASPGPEPVAGLDEEKLAVRLHEADVSGVDQYGSWVAYARDILRVLSEPSS